MMLQIKVNLQKCGEKGRTNVWTDVEPELSTLAYYANSRLPDGIQWPWNSEHRMW